MDAGAQPAAPARGGKNGKGLALGMLKGALWRLIEFYRRERTQQWHGVDRIRNRRAGEFESNVG